MTNSLPVPGDDEVLFVPLGGVGEIGMNVALYGHAGQWVMVDLGVTFGDDTTPGVDLILPDLTAAVGLGDKLKGLVLTHAHEDHVGAIPHLWQQLNCPIYATGFTAAFVRRKFEDEGRKAPPIRTVSPGQPFDVGRFACDFVHVTHSIPEANSLVLRTGIGSVLHTGDWKLDPQPVVGEASDVARLKALGDERPMALIGDSTNALVEGRSGSEGDLKESLTRLIAERRGRVVFACFASNVARLHTIAQAAAANNRHVAIMGRSLRRMTEVARECHLLDDVEEFVDEDHLSFLPAERTVVIMTGSQGEPRAALTRVSQGEHQRLDLDPEDTVVFSARAIPGNEKPIQRVKNNLSRSGVEIITADDAFVHVSGHPARDELRSYYQWVKPRAVIPVHGEEQHLRAHAQLAHECGIEHVLEVDDGDVIRITPDGVKPVAEVETGRFALDGGRLVPLDGSVLGERRRMTDSGAVIATLVLDAKGRMAAAPKVSLVGLVENGAGGPVEERLSRAVSFAFDKLAHGERRDDAAVERVVHGALRRTARQDLGKRPLSEVHVIRI